MTVKQQYLVQAELLCPKSDRFNLAYSNKGWSVKLKKKITNGCDSCPLKTFRWATKPLKWAGVLDQDSLKCPDCFITLRFWPSVDQWDRYEGPYCSGGSRNKSIFYRCAPPTWRINHSFNSLQVHLIWEEVTESYSAV